MSPETETSTCQIAKTEILECLYPQDAKYRSHRFFPRDKLFALLRSGKPCQAQRVLDCGCPTCQKHKRHLHATKGLDEYVKQIVGTSHLLPGNKAAITLFSLFVVIGYPALVRALLDLNLDDQAFEPRYITSISKDTLRKTYFPWMNGTEFDFDFYDRWESYLAHFAVPCLVKEGYNVFEENTIMPFLNEEPIGRKGPNGEIIEEGGYGRVFSFDIYDCYNKLGVGARCKSCTQANKLPA
jgi:hypothetical protein